MKPITRRIALALIVFDLILLPVFLQAKVIEEQKVRFAVETWVRFVTADARPDAVVEKIEPYQQEGETVAYIAHLSGGGFCLCGADDLVLPVYFYSPGGTYDPKNPELRYFLWEINARLRYLQEGLREAQGKILPYQEALSQRALLWDELIEGRIPERTKAEGTLAEPIMMELNLTTHWNQGSFYNNFCPEGDGGLCVVGCVATATAQIMKYWNWPPSGIGTHCYSWDGDQSCKGDVWGGQLCADFSNSYDWVNMPDECWWRCTQAQQNAVAELCYEVGVSVDMDYGNCGSKAYTSRVPGALENYFRYDNDATYGERNMDRMTQEIQWLRPVELDGCDAGDTCHAWVVYGYDKTNDPDRQFRMNLGWGGYCDGWYTCDNVPYGLNYGQHHVTRIAPKDVVKFIGAGDSGDGTPDNPYKNIEEAITKAPDGATLIFRAGSDNTFSTASGTLVIDRPFTLKGKDVTIRKQ